MILIKFKKIIIWDYIIIYIFTIKVGLSQMSYRDQELSQTQYRCQLSFFGTPCPLLQNRYKWTDLESKVLVRVFMRFSPWSLSYSSFWVVCLSSVSNSQCISSTSGFKYSTDYVPYSYTFLGPLCKSEWRILRSTRLDIRLNLIDLS